MANKALLSFDLETLSTSPDAVILSIGAAAMCEETEAIVKFYGVCSIASQELRRTDQATLDWWERQSPEAQAVLTEARGKEAKPLFDVLNDLTEWIGKAGMTHELFPLGNGSSFDVAMLEHAYRQKGNFIPWAFWNVRDLRTLKDVAVRLGVMPQVTRQGTHHNAVDDAVFQAQVAMAIIQALKTLRKE